MKGLPFDAKLPEDNSAKIEELTYAMREIRRIDNAIAEAEAEYGKSGELLDAEETLMKLRRKHFEEV